MKKNRIKPAVSVTIAPDLMVKVLEERERDNTSISAVLRKALRQYYETHAEPSYGNK